jgi:protein-tyrosine sulfotransferase
MTSTPPIFVISHPRSGSTLMRYVIDAHPEVCCPSEVALGRLCASLSYSIGLTLVDSIPDGAERTRTIRAEVRRHVEEIMLGYCRTKGKGRWCDKSTNNIEHLPQLGVTFPDAQFICLYRHGLDVVHSLMEIYRYGYTGRTGELVARSPGNVVDALLGGWNDVTRGMLDFEAANAGRCLQMRYEDLVANPAPVLERMCAFLGIGFDAALITDAFARHHDEGPGDPKIRFTSSILSGRVGKGATLPRAQLTPDTLATCNGLLARLGYDEISRTGGLSFDDAIRATSRVFAGAGR